MLVNARKCSVNAQSTKRSSIFSSICLCSGEILRAFKTFRTLYADVQLPNHIIQVVFLVVLKLSRPCIIGIDLLDEFKSNIDLNNKTISFPHLEGKPSIRIVNEEVSGTFEKVTQEINSVRKIEDNVEVEREEIIKKIEETHFTDASKQEQLERILWRYKAVFRKEPGRLKTYQHNLRVKKD